MQTYELDKDCEYGMGLGIRTCSPAHSSTGIHAHRSRIRYLSQKKFVNFNEFSEIKKIRKNSYKNSLNARV